MMQVEVTEWDKYTTQWWRLSKYSYLTLYLKYTNITIQQLPIRPELLQDPPQSNTLSARDLSKMRKERKAKEKAEEGWVMIQSDQTLFLFVKIELTKIPTLSPMEVLKG